MSELRLILLVCGVVLIAGLYLYGRYQTRTKSAAVREQPGESRVPFVPPEPEVEVGTSPAVRLDAVEEPQTEVEKGGFDPERQKVVTLYVTPATGQRFLGADVLEVLDDVGLKYGQYRIFHRYFEQHGMQRVVFSVANMVEPGEFDLETIEQSWMPGLAFFMVLPGPRDGVDALADMLATARRVASRLHGEVKDENRSTLTKQTAHHLRESIIAFQHRMRGDAARK